MQHDDRSDLSTIDLRSLSHEQWTAFRNEVRRRAHRDRNRAIGIAIGGILARVWRMFARLPKWSGLRAAWISHVRRSREQVAAAQLRGLNDQLLGDMGLTRGEIETRVRFCARRHLSARVNL